MNLYQFLRCQPHPRALCPRTAWEPVNSTVKLTMWVYGTAVRLGSSRDSVRSSDPAPLGDTTVHCFAVALGRR